MGGREVRDVISGSARMAKVLSISSVGVGEKIVCVGDIAVSEMLGT